MLYFIVVLNNEIRASSKLNWPNPSDISVEFFENVSENGDIKNTELPVWNIPAELRNYTNLPPSLWPITAETVTHPDCGKWGF